MDLKYVTTSLKAAGGGFTATITTPRVDKDGERVMPTGLTNRDEYLANPLVYWAHEWAFDPSAEPIAKATSLDVYPDRIDSAATFAPTTKAQNVRALVAGGFVSKTSIGFNVGHVVDVMGVPTITDWALMEYSVVPMPANVDASISGVKSSLEWLASQFSHDAWDEFGPDQTMVVVPEDILETVTDANLTLAPAGPGLLDIRDGYRVIATLRRKRRVVISSRASSG